MHSEFRTAEHRPLDDADAPLVMRAAALMLLTTSVRPWESATHARFDDVVKLPYVITKIYRLLFDSSALRVGQPTQPLAMIIWGLGESKPSARTSTPPARQATRLIARIQAAHSRAQAMNFAFGFKQFGRMLLAYPA